MGYVLFPWRVSYFFEDPKAVVMKLVVVVEWFVLNEMIVTLFIINLFKIKETNQCEIP